MFEFFKKIIPLKNVCVVLGERILFMNIKNILKAGAMIVYSIVCERKTKLF